MENDWYEFVEYGTNKPLPIFLQRNGFSHEAALYIRDHARTYVVDSGDKKYQIKNSLFLCGNISVVTEAEDIRINNPDLFVD